MFKSKDDPLYLKTCSIHQYYFASSVWLSIYIASSPLARCDTKSFFYWSKAGLNSEFSISWTYWRSKAKEPNLSNYLFIFGEVGGANGFRAFAQSERQIDTSKIWTLAIVSIPQSINVMPPTFTMLPMWIPSPSHTLTKFELISKEQARYVLRETFLWKRYTKKPISIEYIFTQYIRGSRIWHKVNI